MRRAGVVLSVFAIAVAATGCASTSGHSWEDEFTARIDGASTVIEEARDAVGAKTSASGWPDVFIPLSRTLTFRSDVIQELGPPDGCEKVQEEGLNTVFRFAGVSYDLPKNMTPQLEHDLPTVFEEELTKLNALTAEAATCAA
jgi:hypothetical protein